MTFVTVHVEASHTNTYRVDAVHKLKLRLFSQQKHRRSTLDKFRLHQIEEI